MSLRSATTPAGDRLLARALASWRADPQARPEPSRLTVKRDWLTPPQPVELDVTYQFGGAPAEPLVTALVDGTPVSLSDPVQLEPVIIPKPWGREVWFTGMEQRGESRIVTRSGKLPLSSYLAAAPGRLCGGTPIVLLKVLAPRPEPLIGELYLELHEQKREVYVVTGVDPDAWPDGTGRLRFGVNQNERARLGDDAFRAAFARAAAAYEALRQRVDAGEAGLSDAEATARAELDRFTTSRPLEVGDVITVPERVPHALSHGVQVVEFQTPTYERLIIASTQPVRTQSRWDSAAASKVMDLDEPPASCCERVSDVAERVARFPDFGAWRARPEPSGMALPDNLPYALAMCLEGQLHCDGVGASLTLAAGDAAFIPGSALASAAGGRPLRGDGASTLCLVAAPGL